MTSINIDDFPIEIDSVFLSLVIDYYRFLSIPIDCYRFCYFDFYRFPTSIEINRPIKWINISDID